MVPGPLLKTGMAIWPASHHDTVDELPAVLDLHDEGSVDTVYQAKARILNQALQEIGMGGYQVRDPTYFPRDNYISFNLVESLLCHGSWAVRVSVGDQLESAAAS